MILLCSTSPKAELLLYILLPVSNTRPPYRNSTSGFDFDVYRLGHMTFCIGVPNFVQIGQCTAELWHHIDVLKMVAMESEIYFRLRFLWLHSFRNVEIYLHTIFLFSVSSTHGSDKTTSIFETDSRHIEILLPFRFWPMCNHRHVILHRPAKFHNRTIVGYVMASYRSIFQDGGPEWESYFGVRLY